MTLVERIVAAFQVVAVDTKSLIAAFQAVGQDVGALQSGKMDKGQNLADVADPSTARESLGLGSMATRNVTISTDFPTGGADGDIWIQVDA